MKDVADNVIAAFSLLTVVIFLYPALHMWHQKSSANTRHDKASLQLRL